MDFRVLGSLEVRSDGHVAGLGSPKQRATLAILLLHAGEIVPTDRLIELLWGERPPRTAAHSVQIYVSELRKMLEAEGAETRIETRPPGYRLDIEPEAIDARRFERLLAEGTDDLRAGDASAAAKVLREALGLWRGPPLSDFAYEEFAQDDIRRLEGLRLNALEELAAAELALGRAQAALSAVEAAIADDPLRERARELQILALYRAGRHPDALRAYQEFRTLLSEELGLDPSPSLQQLQERILLHDPTLAPPTPAARAPATLPIRNPYKGLRAFSEADAGDFFGREALVDELVAALAAGARLLALVGPSGSGKSSVISAGLLPALGRGAATGSVEWRIARMVPGAQPFEALEAALERPVSMPHGGLGQDLDEPDHGLLLAARRVVSDGGRLLLVIDRFEELYSYVDEPTRLRFLHELTGAVTEPGGPVTVVLALRADFYDRPLLHPGFAATFTRGVVSVLPMSAEGVESAVVEPARRVGIEVHPALLSQLIADMSDQPGALPLLQYVLTELFDRRSGGTLTLEEYRALGGLRGVLARRAEDVFESLDERGRDVALQVFLRLVRLGEDAMHSRHRVPVHELTSLGLDPVALSEVLNGFERQRLLTFDRDPASGAATVEVAHEALLGEWERLAGWIDGHRVDLRRQASFALAAEEWVSSGRDPDYLLIGSRLAEFEEWANHTTLQLTTGERSFLDAGIARRGAREAEDAAREERERALERRARWRLWALLGAIALLGAGVTFAALTWLGSGPPDVALLFEGTGESGFGDMAAEGFERAVSEFGLDADIQLVVPGTREVETELRRLAGSGVELVCVGIGFPAIEPAAIVAADHPETRFVVWENPGIGLPNVTDVTFRSEEAAFLAGAAAARRSETGVIGFVGPFPADVIGAYLAGYEAGARWIRPDIDVRVAYIGPENDFSAFASPPRGAEAAIRLYEEGADVVLAAAGESGLGVFEAARSMSEMQDRQLWTIGVDTDQYRTVLEITTPLPVGWDPGSWQPHILTSLEKRLDAAFYAVLADYARDTLAPGERSFGLLEGGVEISYSGGFIDDLRPQLEGLTAAIISGEIEVPTVPIGAVEGESSSMP